MIKLIDEIDIQILKELNWNCRIQVKKLAQIVHLTAPAVSARIANMEDQGIIKKYTLELDLEKVGLHRPVFIQVALEDPNRKMYLKVIRKYRNAIRQNYKTTGDMNYLIEGAFHNNNELNDFVTDLEKIATYRVYDVLGEEF